MLLHPRRCTTSHLLRLSYSILLLTGSACAARPSRRLPFGLSYRGGATVDEEIASPYDAARADFQAYVASAVEECRLTVREQLRRVEEDVTDLFQQQKSLATEGTARTLLPEPYEEKSESCSTVDSIECSEKQESSSSSEVEEEESGEREQQHGDRSNINEAVLSSFTAVQSNNYDPVASELLDPLEPATADGKWTASISSSGLVSEGEATASDVDEAAVKQVVTGEHFQDSTPDDATRINNNEFYDAVESPIEEATDTETISTIPLPQTVEMVAGDRFYNADLIPGTTPDPSMETDPPPNDTKPASSNTISTVPLPPMAEEDSFYDAKMTPTTTGIDPPAEIDSDNLQDTSESLSPGVSPTAVSRIPLPPSQGAQLKATVGHTEVVVGTSSASSTPSLPETYHEEFFDAAQASSSSGLSDTSMQQVPDTTRDVDFFDASSSEHSSDSPIITNISGDEFFDAEEVMPSLSDDVSQSRENQADEHFVDAREELAASDVPHDIQLPQDDSSQMSGNARRDTRETSNDSLGVEIEMSTFRRTRNRNTTTVDGSSGTKKSTSNPEDYLDTFYDASQGIDFVVGDTDEEDEAVVGRLETSAKTKRKVSVEPKSIKKKKKRKKPVESATRKTQARKKMKRRKAHVASKNVTLSVDKNAEEPRAKQSSSGVHATSSEKARATLQARSPAKKSRRKVARKTDSTTPTSRQTRTRSNLTTDRTPTLKTSRSRELNQSPSVKTPTGGKKRRPNELESGQGPELAGSIQRASKNELQREVTRKKKKPAALGTKSPAATTKPESILKTSPSLLAASKQSRTNTRTKRRRKKVSFIEADEEVREETPEDIETTQGSFGLGRVVTSVLLSVRFLLSAAFLLWIAKSLGQLLIFLGVLEQ